MLKRLNSLTTLPLVVHCGLALGAVLWIGWAKGLLDASYAASRHPVDYMTGQTTFSGPQVKAYYAAMSEAGTLDIYVRTQLIDFLFILGFLAIGAFLCTLIARASRDGSWGRGLGLWSGLAIVAGGLCDMIENGWSFIMLANPQGFADWLALPYSGFAVAKFGLITLGMLLGLASVISALIGRLARKPKVG